MDKMKHPMFGDALGLGVWSIFTKILTGTQNRADGTFIIPVKESNFFYSACAAVATKVIN